MSETLYGRRPVLEALRSGARPVIKVYLMKGGRDESLEQIEAHLNARGIPCFYETRHKLDGLAGCDKHQGVVAILESRKYSDLSDLLETGREKNEPLFALLLDEITDPQNLGAIFRNADAAGVHGIVIPKNRSADLTPAAVKASAGAAEHVLTIKVSNLSEAIRKLKDEGAWVYGADAEGERPFFEADFKRPCAIVIGSEGKGLRRLVRENCDELVKIPMEGKIASLNASVASALILFEVLRQRKWGLSTVSYRLLAANQTSIVYPFYSGALNPPEATAYSPPEKDFFRPGPDPAFKTPAEGLASPIDSNPSNDQKDNLPGNQKGGGFRW